MTDANGSSPSVSQNAQDRLESSKWKPGLKWFAAEFMVVVAGILVALGLQAWWQNRQDSARSAEYQRQILVDVRATELTLRKSIEVDQSLYANTKLLSTALYALENPTDAQALQWLRSHSGWIYDPRPILGNVNALIQTGEIRLVANPSARSAIISYASIMKATWEDRDAQAARMVRANDLAMTRLEAAKLPPLLAEPSVDGKYTRSDLQEYFPKYLDAWPRLRADDEFRAAQQLRLFSYSNIAYYNQEMLEATTDLRKRLEAGAP